MTRLATTILLLLSWGGSASGYPLDGYEQTGITRLEAGRLAQIGELADRKLPAGALLPGERIRLRLLEHPELELPQPDAELSRTLSRLPGDEASRYGLALLDLSDPSAPVYAEHRGGVAFNPGSVGKIVVALALFRALAEVHPEEAARRSLLRETRVVADEFILTPSHEVPFWQPGDTRVVRRRLRVGDAASLWTFLDWMLSASSNSAASMVLQQAILLQGLGAAYPPSIEEGRAWLEQTPRAELSALLATGLNAPLEESGLDLRELRQGGFFTSEGKRRIPGGSSTASARSLVRLLLELEQGALIDAFSSLELKRLLYMTERRIRYASSPALSEAAVYYKSGSLYRCAPEPDFECRKYHGNVENVMNSVAIVEAPACDRELYYLVAVTSNVLRKNSAVEHQTLGTRIHRLIERRHCSSPAPLPAPDPPRTEAAPPG